MSDGKFCEKKVRALLEKESAGNSRFAYERLHDARAARGKFPAQTCDFHINTFNSTGRPMSIFLECKETIEEDKISIDAFPQFPRIYRKMLAGATGLLVVWHSKQRVFRFVPLAPFPISTRTFKLAEYPTTKKIDDLLQFIHKYDGC